MDVLEKQKKENELLASIKKEAKAKEIHECVVSHADQSSDNPSVYFFQVENSGESSYECCRMC